MPIDKTERKQLQSLEKNFKLHTHSGWKSFNHDNGSSQILVIDVENVTALQAVMKKVSALNAAKPADQRITLRAASGGLKNNSDSESYSFSPCAKADVIVRLTGDEFRQIQQVTGQKTRVNVGASLQIGEVDKRLYNEFDLSLPTSSLIPYVTVAGLSANAGHGTGINQPSFAGLIQAITFCLPNGEIVRIDKQHPDFETIRASHLGLFGIVLNVELECMPAKKIRSIMTVCSVPEFIDKVKNGLYKQYPYVSTMYMPTYHSDELTNTIYNNVIIYAWEPVDKNTPDMNDNPELSNFNQKLEMQLNDEFYVADLLSAFPALIPYYMRYFAAKIGIGEKSGIAVGPWYDLAHYQTVFPPNLTEFGPLFEVSDASKDGVQTPEIVTAFEKLVRTLTAAAANGEYPLIYAAYVRFFQGTNGGLSMSMHDDKHHVCSMDMTTAHNIPGFNKFFATMSAFMLNELHAKPHWGKNILPNVDYSKMYGESYQQFINVLKKWYEEHGMVFEQSSLLNATFNDVLRPGHPIASPASRPLNAKNYSLSKTDTTKNLAKALLMRVGDDESDEAKALCGELSKICERRTENRLSRVTATLFSCFKRTGKSESKPAAALRK